jgi:shikimate kinase
VAELPKRIVLVGFMGSGKTAVGQALAARLGWGFLDLDSSIERAADKTVARLFSEDGEPRFRRLERDAATAAATHDREVIASGGGAFAQAETREILQNCGTTVYLECDFDRLLARIPQDGSRPLAGNRETMRALFVAREPLYRLAHLTVDASTDTPLGLAARIAEALGFPGPGRAGQR